MIPIAHADVSQAAAWIAPHCAPVPLLTSHSLDAALAEPARFAGCWVGLILFGSTVDVDALPRAAA